MRLVPALLLSAPVALVACGDIGGRDEGRVGSTQSALARVRGPVLSVDTPVMTESQHAIASGAVAATATGGLAVWTDNVDGAAGVYGARLDAAGHLLDTTPRLLVPLRRSTRAEVALASDGTDYLLVWSESWHIHAARIRAADAAVLDVAPGSGRASLYDGSLGELTFGGGMYFVTWMHGIEVRGMRITPAGAVLDRTANEPGAPLGLSSNEGFSACFGDGAFFVVAGHEGVRVRAADGQRLDAPPIAFAGIWAGSNPRCDSDGTGRYYVAWDRNGLPYGTFAARVRASDGVVLDADDEFNHLPGSLQLASSFAESRITRIENKLYRVSSLDNSTYATPVDGATGLLSTTGMTTLGRDVSTRLAVAGSRVLAAVRDRAFLVVRPFAHANGTLAAHAGGDLAVVRSARAATDPVVVSNGDDYLIAWTDGNTGKKLAVRVRGSDRVLLDATPWTLVDAWGAKVSITATGSDYFAVWRDPSSGAVLGRAVAADGTLGVPVTISAATGNDSYSTPAVSYDGTNLFVVWAGVHGGVGWAIRGRRVDRATLALFDDPPIDVGTSTAPPSLAVAVDSPVDPTRKTFFVVWNAGGAIRASRVRAALGRAIDSSAPLTLASGIAEAARVASDGTDVVITWSAHEYFAGWTHTNVFAQRFGPSDGAPFGSPLTIATADGTRAAPDVTWDGTAYVIAWQSELSELITDLYARRVPPNLAMHGMETKAFIASGLGGWLAPAVASRGSGASLVAYPDVSFSPGALGQRIRAVAFVDEADAPDAGADATIDGTRPADGGDGDADSGRGASGDASATHDAGEGGHGGEGGAQDDAAPAGDAADAAVDGSRDAAPDGPAPDAAAVDGGRETGIADGGRDAGAKDGGRDTGVSTDHARDASADAEGDAAAAASLPTENEGGCGCTVPSRTPAPTGTVSLAGLLIVLLRRRSRRSAMRAESSPASERPIGRRRSSTAADEKLDVPQRRMGA